MKATLFLVLCSLIYIINSQGDPGLPVLHANDHTSSEVHKYWTAERLQKALPYLPTVSTNTEDKDSASDNKKTVEFQQGFPPIPESEVGVESKVLFEPPPDDEPDLSTPLYVGTHGPFTSSRVFTDSTVYTYPYRAVCKLFFSQSGGNYQCSCSVLRPRIVLTAGHCVHSGNGAATGWSSNFLVIPAYNAGYAPYGSWTWSLATTTWTWYLGGGGVPNGADFGIIVINDDSSGIRIGSRVGYFGYHTGVLVNNHVTQIGYPCNFDSCNRMHQVTAEFGATLSPNTAWFPSDMRGGASGGPWLADFGVQSPGQLVTSYPNVVIGVTSYGPTSTSYQYLGSSIPNQEFLDILNYACSLNAANCNAKLLDSEVKLGKAKSHTVSSPLKNTKVSEIPIVVGILSALGGVLLALTVMVVVLRYKKTHTPLFEAGDKKNYGSL